MNKLLNYLKEVVGKYCLKHRNKEIEYISVPTRTLIERVSEQLPRMAVSNEDTAMRVAFRLGQQSVIQMMEQMAKKNAGIPS